MMKEFKFPDVGEGIHEGKIVKWHVKEGDAVKTDQVLVEVETDKAVVELPSPMTGTVNKINFHEGTMVKVGESLVRIDEAAQAAKPTPQTQITQSKPASQATLAPQQPVPQPQSAPIKPETSFKPSGRILATPATRKLARDMGVDITKVAGTGIGGRVSDDDVKRASGAISSAAQPRPGTQYPRPEMAKPGEPAPAMIEVHVESGDVRVPLTGLRKIISDRMAYSKLHIPHACGMDFIDVTHLVRLREKEKHIFEPRGIKFTYMPFIIKACVVALRKFPSFNAQYDAANSELVAKRRINIGIAVDTPDGLVVPVIRDADQRTMVDIAMEIERLAQAAREKKLKLDEIKGGTFTITNVGSVGGFFSTPIIDPPQVAIMAVHRIRDMPLVVDGKVEPRKVMGVSLCFDHRVVDGALATEFMNVVMKHLEDPDLLLVDMV